MSAPRRPSASMVVASAMTALLDAPSLNKLFRQLMYGHGVHHAAVVTRDRVEILQTHPVFRAVVAVQAKSRDRHIIAQRIMTRPPQGSQLPNRLHRIDAGAQTVVNRVTAHTGAADHGLAGDPAMTLEITGDTANGVIGVVPDIDMSVSVKIHRISAKAARHELR